MLCKNNLIEESLKEKIVFEQLENERNCYLWTLEYEDINFWEFLSINCLQMDQFFILLDVDSGPSSGWEKFAEILGLTLWEDRKWCHQYHNGVGPTKAVIARLVERKAFDKSLSLSSVLEYLKEMDRYDILVCVEWKSLVDRFRRIQKPARAKVSYDSLTFQLGPKTKDAQYVTAENVRNTLVAGKSSKGKRNKGLISEPIILMSYAPDAEQFAEKVAKQLRTEGRQISGKKIWVIMIDDSSVREKLAIDSYNVLHKWVNQVWFVVPVLSPQYLRQVQNQDDLIDASGVGKFNKLVYSFTTNKFCSNGARNFNCRPICPKELYPQVKNSIIVKGNCLLSVIWCLDSIEEIEEFRKVLMDRPLA